LNQRQEIKTFADIMEYKMSVHDDRGVKWKQNDQAFFLRRMKEEIAELEQKLKTGRPLDIQYECADVANFAMMLSWKVQNDWATKVAERMEKDEQKRREEGIY
jgi:hypothetical protein